MPKYDYVCEECNRKFSLRHSMTESVKRGPECTEICKIKRVYTVSRVIKSKNPEDKAQKPGTIVKKHIEEAKEELKERKQSLKKQEFEKK